MLLRIAAAATTTQHLLRQSGNLFLQLSVLENELAHKCHRHMSVPVSVNSSVHDTLHTVGKLWFVRVDRVDRVVWLIGSIKKIKK